MAFVDALAQYLETAGVGNYNETGVGGDLFINVLPGTPDNAIGLFTTGGPQADAKHGYDSPTIQIRVRGQRDPRPPMNRAESIYKLLHGLDNTLLTDGTLIVNCLCLQSAPVYIGQDSNQRHEYTLNFLFETRPTDLGNRE